MEKVNNMQMCGECLRVYDESENANCPFCKNEKSSSFSSKENEDELPWKSVCVECDGSGRMECDHCEGEGNINSKTCSKCNGDGGIMCSECYGTGYVTIHKGKKISQ